MDGSGWWLAKNSGKWISAEIVPLGAGLVVEGPAVVLGIGLVGEGGSGVEPHLAPYGGVGEDGVGVLLASHDEAREGLATAMRAPARISYWTGIRADWSPDGHWLTVGGHSLGPFWRATPE